MGPRLRHLLELCPKESPVADVGSGHGRLALELARLMPGATVYATEAKAGPARELRRLLGESSPVTVLDGEGLAPLRGRGCRGAVIAGMGGHTIRSILERDLDVAAELAWICVQPMQDWDQLEAWLERQGLWSMDVHLSWERSRPYRTIRLFAT